MATITGNGQANVLNGTIGADIIRAKGGNDTVLGGDGNDSLIGNAGEDSLEGGAGNDTLKGGNGNDWLFGGTGNDKVYGNNGDDILVASDGSDTLNGGADQDTVVFAGNRADYSVTEINATTVIITDTAGNTARVVNVESFQFADVTQSFPEVLQPWDPNLDAGTLTTSDTSAVEGDVLNFDWDIASDGDFDGDTSETRLVLATAPDLASAVQYTAQQSAGVIAIGTSANFSGALDTSGLVPGTYFVAAIADSGEAVSESNETDNVTNWVEIEVETEATDLWVTSIGVGDREIDLNESHLVRIGYLASGNTDAGPNTIELTVSATPDFSSVVYTDQIALAGLAINTPQLTDFTLEWADFAPGTYYVSATLDANGEVAETNETNNQTTWEQITVVPEIVDYQLTNVTVQPSDLNLGATGGAGATLNLSLEAANFSNNGLDSFRVETYLSLDTTLSADDTHLELTSGLGTSTPFTQTSGGSSTIAASYAIHETFSAGDYYVISVIAANGGQNPLDDPSNNTVVTDAITLTGGTIVGTSGDDLFVGTQDAETFEGGAGNDTLIGDNLTDVFMGGDGIDTLDFSSASASVYAYTDPNEGYVPNPTPQPLQFTLFDPYDPYQTTGSADEIERLIGSDYQDFLFANGTEITFLDGGAGDDGIIGSENNDTVLGGLGNDSIGGLYGDDTITGGDGADQFYVDRELESGTAIGHGHDVITDFDPATDAFYFEYDAHLESPVDPLLYLVQTAEGAVLDYATDSSVLLEGVDVADLSASNFMIFEESVAYTY